MDAKLKDFEQLWMTARLLPTIQHYVSSSLPLTLALGYLRDRRHLTPLANGQCYRVIAQDGQRALFVQGNKGALALLASGDIHWFGRYSLDRLGRQLCVSTILALELGLDLTEVITLLDGVSEDGLEPHRAAMVALTQRLVTHTATLG